MLVAEFVANSSLDESQHIVPILVIQRVLMGWDGRGIEESVQNIDSALVLGIS